MNSGNDTADRERVDVESIALLAVLALVGSVPVVAAFAEGLDFGAGETVGLIFVAFAFWSSLRELLRRPR